MMHRPRRWLTTARVIVALLVAATMVTPAAAEELDGGDLRDIRLGTQVTGLPKAGYANLACAGGSRTPLASWLDWHDCPVDAAGFHAITFGYDPATSPEGTIVAGHPAVLTLLVDTTGTASGLRIETDPKARLYLRKKAFLFGVQVKSRYGQDGWSCTQAQPGIGEQPVGGVYVSERCTKTTDHRQLTVERHLFRKPDQDAKTFVDETRLTILRTKD